MSTININAKNIFTKKRPFGVWMLIMYVLIVAGIDLSGDSFLALRGEVAMFRSDQVPSMLLWAYLNIGIIIAGILTLTGWEPGRILFLLLVSMIYLDQGMSKYFWIIHRDFGKAPIWSQINSWFIFIRGILIPILYIWYFNKPSIKEFFRSGKKI